MSDLPPILSASDVPPPLPLTLQEVLLEKYLNRCKVICIVAASFFSLGILGFFVKEDKNEAEDFIVLGFFVAYVVTGYVSAWLIHRRSPAAYTPAFIVILVLLPLIPAGTIFGILGLGWLNKGRIALKRA